MIRYGLIVVLLTPLATSMVLDAVWMFYSAKHGAWLTAWAWFNPLYCAAAWMVWKMGERT